MQTINNYFGRDISTVILRYYIKDLYRPVLLEINKIVHETREDVAGRKPSNGVYCYHKLTLDKPLFIKGIKILGFQYEYAKSKLYNYFNSHKHCEEYVDNKLVRTIYGVDTTWQPDRRGVTIYDAFRIFSHNLV